MRGSPPGGSKPPQPLPHSPSLRAGRPQERTEELMRTCPICGSQLAERKCKLFCPDPRCGYYLSCADYY